MNKILILTVGLFLSLGLSHVTEAANQSATKITKAAKGSAAKITKTTKRAPANVTEDDEQPDNGVEEAGDMFPLHEDTCLKGQDLDAEDVDISRCPVLPRRPTEIAFGGNSRDMVSLGAWELGQTAEGKTYKYGSLSEPDGTAPRVLSYGDGTTTVNVDNIICWAKGYYRLRAILQNPPIEYRTLRNKGYLGRFFQFQTDLRNGPTGFREITSYGSSLVKWVTRIEPKGNCVQPTLTRFKTYLVEELARSDRK